LLNEDKFHLQKSVWDLESPIKSYGQIQERGWKGFFLLHFQTSFLNFVHNFWLEVLNLKWIFGDKICLHLPTFFSSKFFWKNKFYQSRRLKCWRGNYNCLVELSWIVQRVSKMDHNSFNALFAFCLCSQIPLSKIYIHVRLK